MEKIEQQKVTTVFFGSGSFAVKILEALLIADFINLAAVITQQDKPAGRAQEITSSPVKEFLLKEKFTGQIYQPEKLAEQAEHILQQSKPELIIVADYGQILPEKIINYPKYKCLNVHGSLLPGLRGAVPIPMAILKGYKKTGVSILVMTTGLDDGPVIASRELVLADTDTTETLKEKLAILGAELLLKILPDWIAGKITPVPQDQTKVTIADKSELTKDKARITPDTEVVLAERMVRAFYPWPVAWTEVSVNGKKLRLKIFKAQLSAESFPEKGKIYRKAKQLFLCLTNGSLELVELQLEGKKKDNASNYLFLAN